MPYLILYVLATVAAIIWAARKLTREGYLLADRQVPPWAAAASLVVSKFGGGKILAGGSLVFLFGWSAMWFNVGFLLGYILFAGLAFRLKDLADRHRFYTMTDYYVQSAGARAVWPVGFLCLYTMLGFTCLNIIGGAQILHKISDIPYNASVLFVAVFVGFYLIVGGFKSVIVTDVIQAGIIIACFFLFFFFADLPSDLGWNTAAFLKDFGQTEIIYTFFMGFFFPFGMPEVWPRIYAVRKKSDLKQALSVTVVLYVALGISLALLIMGIREDFPDLPPPQAILAGFQSLLPPQLGGLMAVFLFAAVMSSADTYLFQANAALEQDLKGLDRLLPNVQSVRLKMRIGIFAVLVASVAVAFFLPDVVKAILIFSAGNFILGIFGLASRFTTLSLPSLWFGTGCGLAGIALALATGGLSFHVPLYAMAGSLAGIVLPLAFRLKRLYQ